MIAVLVIAMALTQDRAPDLFKTVIKTPTGRNGYEDYLRAANVIADPKAKLLQEKEWGIKAGDPQWLAARKALVGTTGAIKPLVKSGNLKAVFDPRSDVTLDTTFPEYAHFKYVCRALCSQATVEFSSGSNIAAADTLLANLKFSDQIMRTGVLITFLVAIACQSITLAEYSNQLERVPQSSWPLVEAQCDKMLEASVARTAIEHEIVYIASTIGSFIEKPEQPANPLDEPDEQSAFIVASLKRLKANEKAALRDSILSRLETYLTSLRNCFQSPESEWSKGSQAAYEIVEKEENPITKAILEQVLPIFDQVFTTEIKRRTQVRLLKLHGLIQSYRWDCGVLPDKLEDLKNDKILMDPATGKPFVYERTSDGYELYSNSITGLGRVDLVYRRPKVAPLEDEGPVPP